MPPFLGLPDFLSLALSPGARGGAGGEAEALCWLAAGVLLVLAPTLTPPRGAGGEGVLLLLLLDDKGDNVDPLCWLDAGELLGDGVFLEEDLPFFEGDVAFEEDLAGDGFFLGTTALRGGGIWMLESSFAAGGAVVFLPSSIWPSFWPMKVTFEERWKQK